MFSGGHHKLLFVLSLVTGALLLGAGMAMAQEIGPGDSSMDAARISPHDAYQEVTSGKALLVCAYQDEEICGKMMLQGAISLKAFESRLTELTKNQRIIFYCA